MRHGHTVRGMCIKPYARTLWTGARTVCRETRSLHRTQYILVILAGFCTHAGLHIRYIFYTHRHRFGRAPRGLSQEDKTQSQNETCCRHRRRWRVKLKKAPAKMHRAPPDDSPPSQARISAQIDHREAATQRLGDTVLNTRHYSLLRSADCGSARVKNVSLRLRAVKSPHTRLAWGTK